MIKELTLSPLAKPEIAFLIKDSDVEPKNSGLFMMRYLKNLTAYGLETPALKTVFLGLRQSLIPKKKLPKKESMEYLNILLENIDTRGIKTIICSDASYFTLLTGESKLEGAIGLAYDCIVSGFEHIKVLPTLHYTVPLIQPIKEGVMDTSLKVIAGFLTGTLVEPGDDVLKEYKPVYTAKDLRIELGRYINAPEITCDIECTSLRFYDAQLLTIGFSLNANESTVCAVHQIYHSKEEEGAILAVLKEFFQKFKGKLWFHNALFDIKVLSYVLFMRHLDDFNGMDEACEAFNNVHDTMIIAYLAKNSTGIVKLGLKELTKEYLGNYAEDVTEAIKIPMNDLMRYNAKDCCGTWYVKNTYYPVAVQDDQIRVYETIFQPSIKPLIKMMLTGLPLDLDKVEEAEKELTKKLGDAISTLQNTTYVQRATNILRTEAMQKYNSEHKKQKTFDDFKHIEFNPGSSQQLSLLIFDILGFEEIEKTKAGKGSTKREFIMEWLAQAKAEGNKEVIATLEALVDVSQISIIINTFLSAFKTLNAEHPSGYRFLKGNLKLGGTQCVTADTLFTTNRGIIPYSKLKINDLVITHTGDQKPIIDLFSNGIKQIYKVTTTRGHVLKTSAEHPYYVDGGWVTADKLTVGDKLKVMYESVEEWQTITDFPRYMVSSFGRIKNIETGNYLTCHEKVCGKTNRLKVTLSRLDGKRKSGNKKDFHISSLVATYFIGVKPKDYEVRHLNGIAWDNNVKNLAYGTSADNTNDAKGHGTMSKRTLSTTKLTQELVDYIRQDLTLNNVEMSKKLGVSRELIRDVRNLKRWLPQNEFQGYIVEFFDDTVISIDILEPEETFGATVTDDHSHVTNGIVTHNSGRLSSNEPNMQNLPSGSKYGKIIKSCFVAPDGWLFAGADFSALEDRIGAILSGDKNKTLEFAKGFDG